MKKKTHTIRTVETIQAEYRNICSEIGHREYKRRALEMEIASLAKLGLDLNLEAEALKGKTNG